MADAALISGLLTNLPLLIKDEFSLLWNFKREVERIWSTLYSIDAVLEDSERKTVLEDAERKTVQQDKQTEDWLHKLKCVAYEVRNIMDELTLEDIRLEVKRLNASSSTLIQVTNSCFSHPLCNIWMRLKIGNKIKDIQKKLDQISFESNKLHLCESNLHDSKPVSLRQTIPKLSEKIYGRDREKEEIVNILVHSSNIVKEVSVLPILGLGGLGKTTLAQLVYNDVDVTEHFDVKFWVCVSEQFDINLIIKAIIGATDETSLEILWNMIQDKLKGKKYLLVLDDVWNDNIEQWKLLRSILNCGSTGAFILTTTRKKIVAEIMKTVETFDLSPISEDDCWLLLKERAFMYGIPKTVNFVGIGKEIATKCKGVPIAAKTLGSQLAFKNDEKEWCRIRDSEIFILPILRLSYYDLPYYLRRCFAFCAIFPKDIQIEKERLIQLWMAHDLIPSNKNQELEDNGNIIWDELCCRSFFQEEKLNWKGVQTCMMHDLMHDLAQFIMKDECYTIDDKSSSKDFEREIRHVTIMVDEGKELPFASLKNKGGIQSIILHSNHNEKVSEETFSVLKKFSSLRVFEGCGGMESIDLNYVGGLKHLRYLNLSGNVMLKRLPNNICDLLNLQTLNLNECKFLESLPKKIKVLTNLRHLHLEGCDKLKYMPRGMGQLKNLKTLSLFVIGKESDCQLDELRELDIRGSLKIKNLESVSDVSIARGISMSKMSIINKLELDWKDDTNNGQKNTRHEKIGEALEVSTICLKKLSITGYKGVNIPKWVGESSASLTSLWLEEMDNVQHIFNMNTSCEIRMLLLFPLLEELNLDSLKNLRELVSPPIPITPIGAFRNLLKLYLRDCPKLRALAPHLKSLKEVNIIGEFLDELLHNISNLSGLTHLFLSQLDERSVLFGGVNNYEAIMLDDDDNEITLADNNEAQAGGRSTFQSLRYLRIEDCSQLRCLFDEELGAGGERETRGLTNLYHLEIKKCPELMISVEQWKFLLTDSLQYLEIKECPKLVPSKGKEEDEVITLLYSLRARLGPNKFNIDFHIDFKSLVIKDCPELMISVEQWRNITHSLKNLWISGCPKLVPSKEEEAAEVIALLRSVRAKHGPEKINVDFPELKSSGPKMVDPPYNEGPSKPGLEDLLPQ